MNNYTKDILNNILFSYCLLCIYVVCHMRYACTLYIMWKIEYKDSQYVIMSSLLVNPAWVSHVPVRITDSHKSDESPPLLGISKYMKKRRFTINYILIQHDMLQYVCIYVDLWCTDLRLAFTAGVCCCYHYSKAKLRQWNYKCEARGCFVSTEFLQ